MSDQRTRKVARIVHLDPQLAERVQEISERAGETFSERLELLVLIGLDDPGLWDGLPMRPAPPI